MDMMIDAARLDSTLVGCYKARFMHEIVIMVSGETVLTVEPRSREIVNLVAKAAAHFLKY